VIARSRHVVNGLGARALRLRRGQHTRPAHAWPP